MKNLTKKNKTTKTLLAASIAMAMAGSAQADVTVYGKAHIAYDSADYGTNNSADGLTSNSSRFGVKGDAKINEDFKGIYQFESGVDVSGRNGDLFSGARDSFVGVSGGFGTILGGRLGVENQWLYDANLFGDQVGDLGNFWGMTNGVPGRANGVLAYVSPNFGGFDFMVAYKGKDATANSAATVAKANFSVGDLKLGLGYAGLGKGIYTTPAGVNDATATALTASYDAKAVKLVAGLQNVENYKGQSDNQSSWTVGAAIPVNKMTFKAQYMSLTDDLANADSTGVSLGMDYSLGKDTTVYVAYSTVTNDAAASTPADSWGHGNLGSISGTGAGSDPTAFSVGIVQNFSAKVF